MTNTKQAALLNEFLSEFAPIVENWLRTIVRDEVTKALAADREQAHPDTYLTRKETAAALKISLPTLWKYTTDGDIKCVKVGRSVKYAESEVKRFMQERG